LKKEDGAVSEELKSIGVKDKAMTTWHELVVQELIEPEDEAEFD